MKIGPADLSLTLFILKKNKSMINLTSQINQEISFYSPGSVVGNDGEVTQLERKSRASFLVPLETSIKKMMDGDIEKGLIPADIVEFMKQARESKKAIHHLKEFSEAKYHTYKGE